MLYEVITNFSYKLGDVEAIKSEIPNLKFVSPRNQLGGFRGSNNVTRGTKTGAFEIYGDYPEFIEQQPMDILEGRFRITSYNVCYTKLLRILLRLATLRISVPAICWVPTTRSPSSTFNFEMVPLIGA